MALAFSLSTPLAARPFLVSGASSPFAPRQPSPRSAAIRAPVKAVAAQPQQSPAPPDLDSVVMNTYARYAVAMSHGNGAELFDTRGKRYLDCVAGIATCTLGHAHPALIKAVTNQMSRVNHVSNLYYIPEQAALAAWLVSNSPADKVFFCNSGGEANEAAIKLARKYWHIRHGSDPTNIPVIITAHQSFHGRTLATLTATGQPKYHRNWWPLVPGFQYVTYNDAAELKQLADSIGDNLAAILMEACQGEGGIHPASKQFFATARQICDDTGALLMCDEVQVGVGRTGKLWGFDHTGVQPDVFTLAKGLGGGVPIGAMCCTAKCDVFEPGDHASTFGGNPLATAAGLAVANQLDSGVLQNAEQRGAQLMTGLQNLARKFSSVVKEVRGLGLILGVELQGIAASDVVAKAMDRGLLLVPAESVLSIFETVLSDVAA